MSRRPGCTLRYRFRNEGQKRFIFYRSNLEGKYISERASIIHNPNFESGIVNIQRYEVKQLTRAEKYAVKMLKYLPNYTPSGDDHFRASSGDNIGERLVKRRRKEPIKESYVNCDFILGSVAKKEGLWSNAKYISRDSRSRLSPQMFEALLFLKENIRFWDAKLVSRATNMAKSSRSKKKLEEMESYEPQSSSVLKQTDSSTIFESEFHESESDSDENLNKHCLLSFVVFIPRFRAQ